MACDMSKLANFSTEKQQLIALGIDTYTGDVGNYVAKDVDTSAGSMDDVMRERFEKDVLHGEKYNYRTYRKYKNDIFEILETVLDQTLPEGWSENEFFNRFVETIRVDLGDKNEFYAEDNGNFHCFLSLAVIIGILFVSVWTWANLSPLKLLGGKFISTMSLSGL